MSGPDADARRVWTPAMVRVMVTLLLGAGVANLFVIAPRFLGAAGYDKREIGVVMGAFNLASLAMSPVVAALTTRLGYARVIGGGCVLAALGAGLFASADAMIGYAAARAIQGAGMACLMIGAAAYVAESAPVDRLGQALGAAGVLTLVAMALGPVLAQLLHDHLGWPWVWRAGIISGAAGWLVATTLPPAAAQPAPARGATRPAWAALIATALAGVGFGSIWTFVADYGPRVGVPTVTPFFSAYVVAAVTARLALGTLSDRLGRRAVAAPALIGHGAALVGMAFLGARWHLIAIGGLYGLCHGVYYPTLQALVVERAGGRKSAAIAWSTFAFGVGLVTAAFGLGPVARAWGYPAIYWIAAGAGAVAAAVLATSPDRR
ncbi:MAG: MFS transporter [Myxococcales bacterium]|nr:MFS transporter [Myxococcales bacterium]